MRKYGNYNEASRLYTFKIFGRKSPANPKRIKQKNESAEIEILEEYEDAMLGLEAGDAYIVLFNFHKSKGYKLRHHPHGSEELKGLFATRTPNRPNGIGLSICEIEEAKK